MRITTLVLLSFGAGMLFASAINHTSAVAQQPTPEKQSSAPVFVNAEGAVPVVPAIRFCCFTGSLTGDPKNPMVHKVDGTGCVGCSFTNVKFEYGGGAFRLENASVSGTVSIELVGAAANTATFLNLFGMLGCPAQPKPKQFDPNKPIIKTASLKEPELITVSSPYGQ
jgi:hypothetical protein